MDCLGFLYILISKYMKYEYIIIGAGPSGLSAAIYLGRANKNTLVVYGGPRRTSLALHIQNYLGFSDITGPELLAKGMEQAKSFGVEFAVATVNKVNKNADTFEILTAKDKFLAKKVIVASGIDDVLPAVDNMFEFMGETFFTCLDCDGYRMNGKKVCIIGKGDYSARTALAVKQLHTEKIVLCLESEEDLSSEYKRRLWQEKIEIIIKRAIHINGLNGQVESIVFADESSIDCECVLSDLGYTRNDSFMSELLLKRSESGYIETNENFETSVPKLFVVGPINTGPDQVSVAVGEGARGAMHAIETDLDLKV